MNKFRALDIGSLLAVAASLPGPTPFDRELGSTLRKLAPKPERDGIIPAKTIERRGRRQLKRMKAVLSGGFVYYSTKVKQEKK